MFGHPVKMLSVDMTDEDATRKDEDVFLKSHILLSMLQELWFTYVFVVASPRDKSFVMF